MTNDRNRKIAILIVIVFAIATLVSVGFFIANLFTNSSNEDSIRINNYDQYVSNIADSERVALETMLFNTVSYNEADTEKIKAVNDAVIREGSYSQTQSDGIYTTKFIVDIESLKQTYQLQNLYSRQSVEDSDLRDYTSLVICPEKDQLKFGEFTCRDRLSTEAGVTKSDPVLQYLPVSNLDYSLDRDPNSAELKLKATLNLTEVDRRLGEEAAIATYKESIRKWFESKNLNIDDYSITYRY